MNRDFSMQTVRAFATLVSALTLGVVATAQSADISSTPGTWTGGQTYSNNSLVTLYSNGPYITGVGNGAAGANTSELPVGYNIFGYGMQQTAGNRLADDFTVTGGPWGTTSVVWRSYQTGSSTVSTFTSGFLQIWSGGAPNAGGVVLAGDLVTNRLTGAIWSGVYRVTTTTLLNTQRPVFDVSLDSSFAPSLANGTYWVDGTLAGSLASGPWGNPTVPSLATDNGLQFQPAAGWVALIDTGNPVGLNQPQDLPFSIEGNGGGCATPTTYCTAKTSSNGCVPTIGFSGTPTPAGAFTATCSSVEAGQLGVLFWGSVGPAAVPFQGGFLCVSPPVTRFPFANSGGAGVCTGSYSTALTTLVNFVPVGTNINAQYWFRDVGSASGTGLSNGLAFTTCP